MTKIDKRIDNGKRLILVKRLLIINEYWIEMTLLTCHVNKSILVRLTIGIQTWPWTLVGYKVDIKKVQVDNWKEPNKNVSFGLVDVDSFR